MHKATPKAETLKKASSPISGVSSAELLLEAKHLDRISVSDKPPRLGGRVEQLTQSQLETKFGIQWSEGIWGTKADRKQLKALATQTKCKQNSAISERLKTPFGRIVISYMGKEAGYGVFATAFIPRGTFFCPHTQWLF